MQISPSAVFRSPERKDIFAHKDAPDLGRYQINYSLVEKNPVVYSISKLKKISELPKLHDSLLSPDNSQFSVKSFKGIPFQMQTSRKDITEGMPSPHDERFTMHNLLPSSCSKFTSVGSPNLAKYAERHDLYKKTEFSPDYSPNKEYVLPKITHNIKFQSMTERSDATLEHEWPRIFDINMAKPEKRALIEGLMKKAEKRKDKKKSNPRVFSPSNFPEIYKEL